MEKEERRHFDWGDATAAAVVGLGFALLYVATAARHVLGGDAGEFATVAGSSGYAHPPGYPVYSMILGLVGRLPLSSAANEAAMVTGLLGASAVGVLYLALRAWRASRFGALFAALLFGVAGEIWLLHTIPEAFALNHLVVAATLYTAAPDAPFRGTRRIVALGLVAALGVAHHHIVVWLLPVGAYGAYLAVRESDRRPLTTLAIGLACALPGLLSYGYLVLVTRFAPEAYNWGAVDGWSDLVRTFFRQEYGTFSLNKDGPQISAVEQIGLLLSESSSDLLYLPVAAALVGLSVPFVDAWRERESAENWGAVALILATILSGPVFVSLLGRGVSGADYLHLRKFHAQFELLCVFWVGLGMTWLGRNVSRRSVAVSLLVVTVVAGALKGLSYRHDYTGPTVQQYVADTLDALPDDAVLVGDSDHRYFGVAYFQRVRGERPDVDYVDTKMLAHAWYRQRVESTLGFPTSSEGGKTRLGVLLRRILQSGRPAFITHKIHPALEQHFALEAVGTTYRVRPKSASVPTAAEQLERNLQLLKHFRISPRPTVPDTSWNHLVLTHYGLIWRDLSRRLADDGKPERAARARAVARTFAPWLYEPAHD